MLRIVLTLVMIGALVVGGIVLFISASRQQGIVKSARDAIVEVTTDQSPLNQLIEKEKIIVASSSGFFPEELHVWPFDQVYWVNQTDQAIAIEGFPESNEDKDLEFSVGDIAPGESESTYFTYKGRYRYRDSYRPERIGYVIVE